MRRSLLVTVPSFSPQVVAGSSSASKLVLLRHGTSSPKGCSKHREYRCSADCDIEQGGCETYSDRKSADRQDCVPIESEYEERKLGSRAARREGD